MTGKHIGAGRTIRASALFVAALAVAGCDENGEFAFPASADTAEASSADRAAPLRTGSVEQDVERPDVFEVSDRGLWDGRPSLGGVWVAHPDVTDPERVIIRNPANGQSVIGALFRRERENPGPPLQISSDAAEALGILAGAPTAITVVALRREEVEVEMPEAENPVVAGLDAPVNVEQMPLDPVDTAKPVDPVAGAAAAIAAAEAMTPAVEVNLPPAAPAMAVMSDAPEEPVEATPALTGLLVQIGVFSVQPNADGAAEKLRTAGVATTVLPEQAGGRTVWRVVSGPAADTDAQAAMLAQIKELGFVDAFGFEG